MPLHRQKVFAYITSDNRLLVFEHVHHDAGIQVPAGTLKPGEDPIDGAIREAFEETGLARLSVIGVLGTADHDDRPWGRDEIHHRIFVHLRCDVPTPETWEHWEGDPDDAPGTAYLFRLFWRSLDDLPPLCAGHDAFVHCLGNVPT